MIHASVGGLLRKARLHKKLTLRQVSEAVGVSIAYVSDVERDYRPMSATRIPQFAKALKLSEGDTVALYRAAGILPDGVLERLLQAEALWDADFVQLVKVINGLDESPTKTALLAAMKPTPSRREKRRV